MMEQKSAKGLIKIDKTNGSYQLVDQVNWNEESGGCLKEVFRDGKLLIDQSLEEIRQCIKKVTAEVALL